MSVSAMKCALQSLESVEKVKGWNKDSIVGRHCTQSAHFLRQAIAEAEKQEPVAWFGDADGFPVYAAPVHARPVVHAVRCTYPQCQATNGCVGACSKTAPVHASDMSEKHVHESDKDRHEWGLVTDDALIEEVRRRGFTIRDAQISPKIKDEYELCCQKYDTCTEPCTPRGRHLAKREWVGLTDEEIYDYADKFLYQHGSNYGIKSFGKAIEDKLREKNT